jgi:hypothetical protein
MAEYGAYGECEKSVSTYINALIQMEHLRDKVREQHEDAPGRLMDLFDQMPRDVSSTLHIDEGPLLESVKLAAKEGLRVIDAARDEMMRRGTKKVAVYLPSYRPQLEKLITGVEQSLFREAMDLASGCLCANGQSAGVAYPKPERVAERPV